MSEERANLEKIAPTVEEAIEMGLTELGLSEQDIDIEILDEGSKGLLGLGSRQARVRLTIKGDDDEQAAAPTAAPTTETAAASAEVDEETANVMAIAQATVAELLEKMQVEANVNARTGEISSQDGFPNIHVDITGDDLSILIGRRAETLHALQYIARMIVGKEIGRSAHLLIDVEGYRQRREHSLTQLATQMAQQAVKSGRSQSLEPMSASDRRIIHIALRDNEDVSTESEGEEPRRKVVIAPVGS